MSGFSVLLDAPGEPTGALQLAALGDFQDGRYGDFAITADDVQEWASNLAHLPGQRALIDLDHKADRSPRDSEAAGWITGVRLEDGVPKADVEWTPKGEAAIREKRYLFFSPTYGDFKDETGTIHANTLVGGALTNKPFLTSMPMLTLASEEALQQAVDQDEAATRLLDALAVKQRDNQPKPQGGGSDSRRAMDAQVLKLLDLPEDTDDAKLLEAVTALKAKADKEPAEPVEPKTLEQQAGEAGKVLLDSTQYAELRSDATAGREAAKQLHAEKFDRAFEDALRAGRAVEAQRETKQKFYSLDAEATLKELAEGPVILNTRPRGQSYSLDDDIPNGVHPESHQLDQKVRARLKELGKGMDSYIEVYELMQGELVNGNGAS